MSTGCTTGTRHTSPLENTTITHSTMNTHYELTPGGGISTHSMSTGGTTGAYNNPPQESTTITSRSPLGGGTNSNTTFQTSPLGYITGIHNTSPPESTIISHISQPGCSTSVNTSPPGYSTSVNTSPVGCSTSVNISPPGGSSSQTPRQLQGITPIDGIAEEMGFDMDEIYQVLGRDILKSSLLDDIDLYLECEDDSLYIMPTAGSAAEPQPLDGSTPKPSSPATQNRKYPSLRAPTSGLQTSRLPISGVPVPGGIPSSLNAQAHPLTSPGSGCHGNRLFSDQLEEEAEFTCVDPEAVFPVSTFVNRANVKRANVDERYEETSGPHEDHNYVAKQPAADGCEKAQKVVGSAHIQKVAEESALLQKVAESANIQKVPQSAHIQEVTESVYVQKVPNRVLIQKVEESEVCETELKSCRLCTCEESRCAKYIKCYQKNYVTTQLNGASPRLCPQELVFDKAGDITITPDKSKRSSLLSSEFLSSHRGYTQVGNFLNFGDKSEFLSVPEKAMEIEVGTTNGDIRNSGDSKKTSEIKIKFSIPQYYSVVEDNVRYRCTKCKYTCTREILLKDHRAKAHRERGLFTCGECNYVGQLFKHLQKHVLRKHNVRLSSVKVGSKKKPGLEINVGKAQEVKNDERPAGKECDCVNEGVMVQDGSKDNNAGTIAQITEKLQNEVKSGELLEIATDPIDGCTNSGNGELQCKNLPTETKVILSGPGVNESENSENVSRVENVTMTTEQVANKDEMQRNCDRIKNKTEAENRPRQICNRIKVQDVKLRNKLIETLTRLNGCSVIPPRWSGTIRLVSILNGNGPNRGTKQKGARVYNGAAMQYDAAMQNYAAMQNGAAIQISEAMQNITALQNHAAKQNGTAISASNSSLVSSPIQNDASNDRSSSAKSSTVENGVSNCASNKALKGDINCAVQSCDSNGLTGDKGKNAPTRLYYCDQCPRTFRQKRSVNAHVNTHWDSYPHRCEVCDKAFSCKNLLNQHKRIHTTTRGHHCAVTGCNKAFRTKSKLREHTKLVHSALKKITC